MADRPRRYIGFLEGLLGFGDDENDDPRGRDIAGTKEPRSPGRGSAPLVDEGASIPRPPNAVTTETSPRERPESRSGSRTFSSPSPRLPQPVSPEGGGEPDAPEPGVPAGEPRADRGRTASLNEIKERLDNPIPERRASVLREVLGGEIRSDEMAAIARCLADPALEVRRLAVQVYEQSSVSPDIDALASARLDPEPSIRSRIMHLLARSADPRSLPWLVEAIASDDDRDVAGAAIMAVPRLLEAVEAPSEVEGQVDALLEAVGLAREERRRFAREFREIASGLDHAHLVAVLTRGSGPARVGAAVLALASEDEGLLRVLAASPEGAEPFLDELARAARAQLEEPGESPLPADDADSRTIEPATAPAALEEPPTAPSPGMEPEHREQPVINESTPVLAPEIEAAAARPFDAAAALISGLDDPDPEVRRRSEEGLNRLPSERVLDWLAETVRTGDEADIERVARIAARSHADAAAPLLAERALALPPGGARSAVITTLRQLAATGELLDDWRSQADPARRADAVKLAAVLDPFSTTEALVALGDRSPRVRSAALQALPERLPDEVAERLLGVIDTDASAEVRAGAVRAFAAASVELRLDAARRGLDDTDPTVRVDAVGVLGPIGHQEVSLLARALTDEPVVASAAARALAAGGTGEDLVTLWGAVSAAGEARDEVIDVLLEFDRDALMRVVHQSFTSVKADDRALAALVLRRLPDVDVDELLAGLTDPAAAVRAEVLKACIERPSESILEHVAGRLRDPDGSIRVLAAKALAHIDDDWALQHLLEASRDPLDEVRQEALRAVDARRSPAVVRLLVDHLASPELGRVASDLLVGMAPDVLDLLLAALDDDVADVRQALGLVLAEAGQHEVLIEHLDHVAPERRRRAVQALAAAPQGARFADRIAGRLADPDPSVRIAVAEALAEMRDPTVVEALKQAFVSDPDMDVVAAVEGALRRLTGQQVGTGPEDDLRPAAEGSEVEERRGDAEGSS